MQNTDINVIDIWCTQSEIPFFNHFNYYELTAFIGNFDFISIQKGNYQEYIVVNKILFIIESIKILEFDIKQITEILNYNGFEILVEQILSRNSYITKKNFRFSDKSNFKLKTSQKRYEIDVIGIYSKFVLLIDAKQWKRKDSFSLINKAANLQLRRVIALKKNPEIFSKLVQALLGNRINLRRQLPFILIPLMLTLENNSFRINENQIPLVSIYEMNSFLQELQNNISYFYTIKINKINIQKRLI
ncbi:MAG: hypothetical protein ACFFCE_13965 [Promethearchaeota archaeon]